jgi:predicted dehydrogenase
MMRRLAIPLMGVLMSGSVPAAEPLQQMIAVQLRTVAPGHFHAALVQKFTLPRVMPQVQVFAPAGDDLDQHLKRISGFNSRADNPTKWEQQVYTGDDWLDKAMAPADTVKFVAMRPGDAGPAVSEVPRPTVVVLSGNNARKSDYITRAIDAGLNVLADKPMIIRPEELPALEAAFAVAKRKGVLLYDIMTERFEITTILQRELSRSKTLFGALERGSPEEPSVTKISVHNFSKVVAGSQLIRPAWFFDPEQQGAGIVDVTTHLVDLVQWEAFPDKALAPRDAKVLSARRWATPITREQFARVTGAMDFPAYLSPYVRDGVLQAPANGEFTYTLKGIHARVSVTWDFEAPPGAGDAHFSVMRGTRASLIIRQGQEQGYRPALYVERNPLISAAAHEKALRQAITEISARYPGIGIRAEGDHHLVVVPDRYHNGHEAHFTQVTENFLAYLRAGKLPDWEVPNMITKYATIMQAYELSR